MPKARASSTTFVDIDRRRVVFIADGKDADTVAAFADHVDAHNADASRIKEVCIDLRRSRLRQRAAPSSPWRSHASHDGVTDNLTEAEITFDKFHVMKLIGEAVDRVRRDEVKSRPELKRSRYLWLRNENNLTAEQSAQLGYLSQTNLITARAYHQIGRAHV